MTNHTITIFREGKRNPAKAPMTWAFITAVIGTGALMDSAAMQWLGFVVIIFVALAAAAHETRKNSRLTIAEARRRLDEIEREEALQTAGDLDAKAAAFRADMIERVTRKGSEGDA